MINYNSEQLSAIKHDPSPLLILAGAGTGKTTTIVARIAELISKKNIKPQEILVLTYTVKAAENFKERLSNIVGSEIDSLQSYNYHAFAKLVSMEFYRELGYSNEPELITDSDIYFLIRKHIDTVNLLSVIFKRDPIEAIKSMKSFFDRVRDDLVSYDELVRQLSNLEKTLDLENEDAVEYYNQLKDIINIYPLFQDWKRNINQLDFGDMILNLWNLVNNNKQVLQKLRKRYRHIVIDEFQDNNYALSKIIAKIASPYNSITVVGDDDQSIYSFRGANIYNIYDFKNKYQNVNNYKEIALMENYRSRQPILDIGNSLISKNSNRIDKGKLFSNIEGDEMPTLYIGDKESQMGFISDKIYWYINNQRGLGSIAILCRSHSQCESLRSYLTTRGIPVNYSNDKLFEKPVIKNIVSWINLILESDIEYQSLIRIIGNRFGNKRASLLSSDLVYNRQGSLLDAVNDQIDQEDIKEFCLKINDFKKKVRYKSAQEFIWEVLCFSNLYRTSDDLVVKSINQFRSFVKSYINIYNTGSLNDLCSYININYDVNALYLESGDDLSIASVQLMTAHNAKGKEFDTVFLPFLSSGSFPMNYKKAKTVDSLPNNWKKWGSFSQDDKLLHIEEERRLFYVAITRAKNNLYLFTTDKRRSKFLSEIDVKLYHKEDILIEAKENSDKNKKDIIFKRLYKNLINENFADARKSIDDIEVLSKLEKGLIESDEFSRIELDAPSVLSKPVLSSSSIETYKECPLKFKYQSIDRIEGKSRKPFFSLGNTIHNVLELFHSEKKSTLDDLMELLDKNWDSYGYEFEVEEKQYLEDAKDMITKYYNYIKDKDDNVFSTEDDFSFELSNCTIKGRCDRIDVTKDNGVRVVDYKTSKKKMTEKEALKSVQLAIYAMYVKLSDLKNNDGRQLGSLPEKLIYLFLRFDEPEVSIQYSNDQLEEFREEIESIASRILSKDFNPVKGYHCRYCDYKDLICSEWNKD